MKELVEQYGYTPGEYFNEWIKGTWTIRFEEQMIEAFQDLSEKSQSKYTVMPKDYDTLKMVLDSIENMAS